MKKGHLSRIYYRWDTVNRELGKCDPLLSFETQKAEILFKVAMVEGSQSNRAAIAKASDDIPKRKTMLDPCDVHLSFKLELYFQL